jgi:hypothetical protein
VRSGLPLLEVAGGRSLEQSSVRGEPGAVQRAIPRLLKVIEANNAAEVRADGRESAGPAIDRRNGYRLTPFGPDDSGAFGWRAVLVFNG